MRSVILSVFCTVASGAVVKAPVSFLSKNIMTMQSSLEMESSSLDHQIQTVAQKLEPGATRDFLKTLRLCAPCKQYARVGEDHDGGYVMCEDGLDKGLIGAYSYGINGFDGWGMSVASQYNIPLNEYDCTNANQPAVCDGCTVHFHNECILNNNAPAKSTFKTFTQQFQDAGNAKAADRSLLLKIDVEAAEWKIFAEEPVENMRKFRQIVVEYHWINQKENHDLYFKAVEKIEAAGFAVTHLHGNNYGGGLQYFGEYSIPNVLEVTYIQKPAGGCAANVPYHIPLDQTNNAALQEIPDATLPTKL